jgi:hypothetical protein
LAGGGPELRAFAAVRLDPARLGALEPGGLPRPPLGEGTTLSAGLEGHLGSAAISLEGLYTAASLQAGDSSGWFSRTQPLPAQTFSLYGLGMLLSTPHLSLSGDLAWSRTSIRGGDLYAGLGLRVGTSGSWQLSLAADGAGRNYTGSDGVATGSGFRTGGKFEWRHSRVGLFRINTSIAGPGLYLDEDGEPDLSFNRSSSGLSYRPPATTLPLRLSRISLDADRDAQDADAVKDSAALALSLTLNPQGIADGLRGALTLNLSGSLTGTPVGDSRSPWPVPGGPYRFESLKAGGELSWSRPLSAWGMSRGNLSLAAGLDYTRGALTESRNFDLRAALGGGGGRFSLALSYPAFPWEASIAPWELSLGWKLER